RTRWLAGRGKRARRERAVERGPPAKEPPKRPLYHFGSSDITRSKPQSDTVTSQTVSRMTAIRFLRARSRPSSDGIASRSSARTKTKHTANSTAAHSHVRNQKNGGVGQGAVSGLG